MSKRKHIGTVSLKKYVERIFLEKDKALNAALISQNERLTLLNELRSGVATKDEVNALCKVVDDLKKSRDKGEGKGMGIAQIIGAIAVVVSLAIAAIALFLK